MKNKPKFLQKTIIAHNVYEKDGEFAYMYDRDYMWPEEEVGEWKEIADCINRYQDVHDCELFKILYVKEATKYSSENVVVLFKKL